MWNEIISEPKSKVIVCTNIAVPVGIFGIICGTCNLKTEATGSLYSDMPSLYGDCGACDLLQIF